MAKRRKKRVQLGGAPVQHLRAYRKALQTQQREAQLAITLANKGRCSSAFSAFDEAMHSRGEANAHKRYITTRSGQQRTMPAGTVGPLRTLNEARRVLERVCIVKDR